MFLVKANIQTQYSEKDLALILGLYFYRFKIMFLKWGGIDYFLL